MFGSSHSILNHHSGTKLQKENIKRKIEANQFQQALVELDNTITEHESSYSYVYDNKKEKYGEYINLQQARNHLKEIVIDEGNPSYYHTRDGNVTIKPHSEKVKEILSYTPKRDYSDPVV